MRVDKLIEELKKYPLHANARAYEGEVCGIVIENTPNLRAIEYRELGVIHAHESENTLDRG